MTGLAEQASPLAADPIATATPAMSSRAAFFLLASLIASFVASSVAPTPVYPIYQARWGLSALDVTVMFAVYSLSILGSLLVTGRLSDHLGRRSVLIVATLLQAITMLMFATTDGISGILLARCVQGLGTGAALATLGAALVDVDKVRGPAVSALTPMLGTALGGLLAGLVVHFLPAPTASVFLLLALIFVAQAIGVMRMPETISPRVGAMGSLKPQLAAPRQLRARMLLAAPVVIAVWTLIGFYASLGPALMHGVLGLNASLAGGLLIFALTGSSVVSAVALQSRTPRFLVILGSSCLLIGMIGALLALASHAVGGFVAGTIVAGLGIGAAFQGAVRNVMPFAQAHERAAVFAVILVLVYLSMGIPAVIAGFAVSRGADLLGTALTLGSGVLLLVAAALIGSAVRVGDREHARVSI